DPTAPPRDPQGEQRYAEDEQQREGDESTYRPTAEANPAAGTGLGADAVGRRLDRARPVAVAELWLDVVRQDAVLLALADLPGDGLAKPELVRAVFDGDHEQGVGRAGVVRSRNVVSELDDARIAGGIDEQREELVVALAFELRERGVGR